jgi:heptose-I-phosphate ethanolaminephosphotransferase
MEEAVDFVSLIVNPRLLLLVPYIFLFIIALLKTPQPLEFSKAKWLVSAVLLISSIYFADNIIHQRFVRKALPQTIETGISFYREFKIFKQLKERKIKKVEAQAVDNKYNHVFILIIGESLNRNHCSLYGYDRKTTPRLEKRDDIIIFDNVITPYGNTIPCVLSMLSEANYENKQDYDKAITIIDIMHSAGFKTYWISNQSPLGVWDNAVFNVAKTADVRKFVNIQSNTSVEVMYVPSYDMKLIEPLSDALKDDEKNKFIILHLMGNHADYSKRYPNTAEFTVFNEENETWRINMKNTYDNSILYNDFVVDSMFNLLKLYAHNHPNMVLSSIYLSDHGENVYDADAKDYIGHGAAGERLFNSISEIPFIIWLSETYKEIYPQKTETIRKNTSLPFMTDDLLEIIMDITNIKTPYFNKERSLINPDFNPNRKRILFDERDYDVQKK